MALKCTSCKHTMIPPRAICPKCHSSASSWIPLSDRGHLVSYTVIHSAPPQFQPLAPYAVGIVELDQEGVRIPGMIKAVKFDEIEIGMRLAVDFEPAPETSSKWTRYYFKPAPPA